MNLEGMPTYKNPERYELAIKAADLGQNDRDIARIMVIDDQSRKAFGFFSVKLVNGRVRFTLTVKKNNQKETIKHATGDWVSLADRFV